MKERGTDNCKRCNGIKVINAHNPPSGFMDYQEIPCPDCSEDYFLTRTIQNPGEYYSDQEVIILPAVWVYHELTKSATLYCCGKRLAEIDKRLGSGSYFIRNVPTPLKVERGPYTELSSAKAALEEALKAQYFRKEDHPEKFIPGFAKGIRGLEIA